VSCWGCSSADGGDLRSVTTTKAGCFESCSVASAALIDHEITHSNEDGVAPSVHAILLYCGPATSEFSVRTHKPSKNNPRLPLPSIAVLRFTHSRPSTLLLAERPAAINRAAFGQERPSLRVNASTKPVHGPAGAILRKLTVHACHPDDASEARYSWIAQRESRRPQRGQSQRHDFFSEAKDGAIGDGDQLDDSKEGSWYSDLRRQARRCSRKQRQC